MLEVNNEAESGRRPKPTAEVVFWVGVLGVRAGEEFEK